MIIILSFFIGDIMKLFDVIPKKFFNILSSPNKEIYADCIFLMYEIMHNFTSFGVERDILVDALTNYFETIDEENIFVEDEEVVNGARNRANLIIRKLNDCGWIDIETNHNYIQFINFYDYAISFIETMDKLRSNERLEYQGYVYSIYSLLFSQEKMLKSIMLEQVYENVRKLVGGLKSLNSNIKNYLDRITKLKTVEEIMNLQFNDYEENIIDKSYHRLKTSDNVSKFRPKIIDKLEEMSHDGDLITLVSQQLVEMEKMNSIEESYQYVRHQLNNTINSLMNIDDIIHDIDHKHYLYLKASLTRVKFVLNNKKDLEGQINEILKYIVQLYIENNVDLNEDDFDLTLFDFYPQSFMDQKSLYVSTEGRKSFNPLAIDSNKIISSEERNRRIALFKQKSQSRITKANINEYVLKHLGDKLVINASQLPIDNMNDFIKMMYVLVYSKSKLMKYKVKYLQKMICKNEFTFDDFEIWRK